MSKERVIDELAGMVSAKNPANRVDLTQPELSVLVEIIRNMCCISVLPDYYHFKKYNLLEIAGIKEGAGSSNAAEGGDSAEGGTVPEDDQEAVENNVVGLAVEKVSVDGGGDKGDMQTD